MSDLRGRLAVVTGASSGIGWHTALALARRGCRLAVTARRGHRLAELSRVIEGLGAVPPLAVTCDVTRVEQVEELRRRVEEAMGPVDILVNNAGRGAHGAFVEVALEDLEAVVAANLLGVIYCTRAFLPAMLARRSGHLVFVSSVLGELPAPGHAVYGATKFAVTGLAHSLDGELAGQGVRVTLVEPGLVRTEFGAASGSPPGRYDQVPSRSPGEVGEEIARAIARGQWRCVPDRLGAMAIAAGRHFPRTARWVARRVARRLAGDG
ncbi:MAG: SDR family NAD(P)-dependent oxidoreductase [Gemmatimonadota bacterium]